MSAQAVKRVAIVQSNYIPWKGYFDLIRAVDEFILFDDMQYTRRDWRNRNKIKTPNGLLWLSISVQSKGKYFQAIKDTKVSDPAWNQRHWKTIVTNYSAAPYFSAYKELFEDLYLSPQSDYLSVINKTLIQAIANVLGIQTPISQSMDYAIVDGKTERLVSLCKQVGGTRYLSGPSAKDYIDLNLFEAEGISVQYADYSGYLEYSQPYPPFEHGVSILDLLFSVGPDCLQYMKVL